MFWCSNATKPGSPIVLDDNYDQSRSDMLLCGNMIQQDHPTQNKLQNQMYVKETWNS
jgi:hypothetical protein